MITSRLCCIIFIHCHRWTPWCMVIIIIICTGITVKLWRARIGLFSGGRPGDCDNKVKLPQWYTDYIVGILLQKWFKVECMHILKFLSFQDKTEFLKHTGNVSLLVISIVVLLHSLVHTPFVLSCMETLRAILSLEWVNLPFDLWDQRKLMQLPIYALCMVSAIIMSI